LIETSLSVWMVSIRAESEVGAQRAGFAAPHNYGRRIALPAGAPLPLV
jgi:hypothetical protein